MSTTGALAHWSLPLLPSPLDTATTTPGCFSIPPLRQALAGTGTDKSDRFRLRSHLRRTSTIYRHTSYVFLQYLQHHSQLSALILIALFVLRSSDKRPTGVYLGLTCVWASYGSSGRCTSRKTRGSALPRARGMEEGVLGAIQHRGLHCRSYWTSHGYECG